MGWGERCVDIGQGVWFEWADDVTIERVQAAIVVASKRGGIREMSQRRIGTGRRVLPATHTTGSEQRKLVCGWKGRRELPRFEWGAAADVCRNSLSNTKIKRSLFD
jgi:hypothetical protein